MQVACSPVIERGEKTASFDAVGKVAKALKCEYYELFLPDRLATGEVEQRVRATLANLDIVDAAALNLFFNDLLAALRRFETKSST